MADYLSKNEGKMMVWLTNLINKTITIGGALGIPQAQLDAAKEKAQQLLTAMVNTRDAKAAYKKEKAIRDAQHKESIKTIRALVAVMKSSPGWTDAMGKDLMLDTPTTQIDPTTYKARLTAKLDGSGVLLRLFKGGVDAVNIYGRLQGETEFKLLQKVTRATYADKRPLTIPGVAEIRQYMIRGVIADQEIGHASDIVTISFGG